MSLARRPASELPGDPAQLRLVYSHGHSAVPYEDEDTLENWHVSIRAYHDEEEECAGGCTDACQQLIEDGSEVGRLRLWRLRDYTGADRWMVADAESGDLESIASAVLDDGEYSAAFQEAIDCPVGVCSSWTGCFWPGPGAASAWARCSPPRLSAACPAAAARSRPSPAWPNGPTTGTR
ncbi:hypothetical protein ACIBL8_46550 [Streptomyces sp. NPDC050523]|uniref:hypothetical protein n=1 Tax=Streptomyces sp. NPDC050523 TaxID=3365622 RepID=UPI00379C9D4D